MEITILVDNTVLPGRGLLGEHGFSAYVRDGRESVLFDTGQSGIAFQNAAALGIDPLEAGHVVLSHCHLDHTWGLVPYLRAINAAGRAGRPRPHPVFLAHPEIFRHVEAGGEPEIGMILPEETLARHGEVRLSRDPVRITDDIVFLGEIPRIFPFEGRTAVGTSGGKPDLVPDDTALACRTDEGIVVVTGCAHAGICSVVEHAKDVLDEEKVADVVGGFHLGDAPAEQVEATCRYFRDLGAAHVHPCHCTGFRAAAIAGVARVGPTGAGLRISFGSRS